jgi:cytochrome P450
LYPEFLFSLSPTGRKFHRNCEFVHKIAEEIIQKRKTTLLEQGESALTKNNRYLDFLDVLLTAKDDTGQGLTDQEIRDEVDTFLFEGHDTTASGISWTLYSLARYPEHQKLCQQEIDEVLADRKTDDIEWDDLPKLKYTTMCIKEALRLHTPVPIIMRQTTQDMTIEGHFLPARTMVVIPLYVLHHNTEVWEEPEEYRPERFTDENIKTKDNFAFVPFSAGPRNCIGQHFALHEMKTAIAKIMRRFTLSLDPTRSVEHRLVVIVKAENGMYVKATPRERKAN